MGRVVGRKPLADFTVEPPPHFSLNSCCDGIFSSLKDFFGVS